MNKRIYYLFFMGVVFASPLFSMDPAGQVSPQKFLTVTPPQSPVISPVSPRRAAIAVGVSDDSSQQSKVKKKLVFDRPSSGLSQLQEESTEEGVARFLSSEDDLPYVMRDVYKNPDLIKYAAQSFVFSQQGVIDAMNEAVNRGAVVDLVIGTHYQNKMDQYKATTIKCDKSLHGKNIAGLSCSPSKGSPERAVFVTGSANPTDAIWPSGNFEAIVAVEGDIPLAKKAYQLMKSQSPAKEKKEVVKSTPTKRDVYSSQKTALNKSRAARIETVAKSTDPDRIVWASTMNINDKDIAVALSKAAKSGADTRLIVNKSALTQYGVPLLKDMAKAGVKVKVFYPVEGSRMIQHKKEIIRNDLYIVSNANFTDEGDTQKNLETYFPADKVLIADAKLDFERVEAKCVDLDKALELFEESKKKAEEKKKKQAEEKKSVQETKKKVKESPKKGQKRKLPASAESATITKKQKK